MLHWFRKYPPVRRKLTIAFGLMVGLIAACAATGLWMHAQISDLIAHDNPVIQARIESSFSIGLAIFGGSLALAIVAAIAFRKAIADPYVQTVVRMEALAAGDLDSPVRFTDYHDCVGRLTRAMHAFRDAAVARIAAERMVRRNHESQKLIVDVLATGLGELAAGNIAHRIDTDFPDEYRQLRTHFNAAGEALSTAITSVSVAATGIRTGSSEISSASDDLSRRTEQQAAALEETAATIDQLTSHVRDTANSATEVAQSVSGAQQDATVGGRIVREAVSAMGGIEKSSQEIAQIISVIDGIAFQTNLLALNAGVEAARAGDAGKGFAVVANEVRALAQRSADAAKDIKELITESSRQVDSGVRLVNETGDALGRIVAKIDEISHLVHHIADAAQEQVGGIQQVNAVMSDMDKMTQQNAAMVEQSTAAARSLAHEADTLAGLVAQFRIDRADATRRATRPVRAARPAQTSTPAPRALGNLALAPEPEGDWTEF